jgi:hypothetical protein
MYRLLVSVLLALSATVLFGQSGDEPADNLITIYTQYDHPPSAVSLDQMKIELEAIMAPLNLRFGWRPLESASGSDVLAEILVVTFKGTCQTNQTNPLTPGGSRKGALGWTHVSDGEVLPFTDVDCDKIRNLLTFSLASESVPERELMFGRAMARVMAHEMYHFFTNTTKHASTGVAKAFYTAAELACPHLNFEDEQIRQVRKGRLKNLLGTLNRAPAGPAGGG